MAIKLSNILWDDLALAFEDSSPETQYYLDVEDGEVIMISEFDRSELEFADGDIGEADVDPRVVAALEGDRERFRPVPEGDSREGYRDMEDFIETVSDVHLRDLLEVAIQGRGAFRRFKDTLLRDAGERDRWFAFKRERTRQRVRSWLESEGLLDDEE